VAAWEPPGKQNKETRQAELQPPPPPLPPQLNPNPFHPTRQTTYSTYLLSDRKGVRVHSLNSYSFTSHLLHPQFARIST
jgi:hypothetical protein